MPEITAFQKRVLGVIERSPNKMANTWEIAWNGFTEEWNADRWAALAQQRGIYGEIVEGC